MDGVRVWDIMFFNVFVLIVYVDIGFWCNLLCDVGEK